MLQKKLYRNEELNKEILDSIQVGDRLLIPFIKKWFKVVGVSENFIFATLNLFGELYHTVLDKNPYPIGKYYCGPMNCMFCPPYDSDTPEGVQQNLAVLESGEFAISSRRDYIYSYIIVGKEVK